jgi:hypothetical protein
VEKKLAAVESDAVALLRRRGETAAQLVPDDEAGKTRRKKEVREGFR